MRMTIILFVGAVTVIPAMLFHTWANGDADSWKPRPSLYTISTNNVRSDGSGPYWAAVATGVTSNVVHVARRDFFTQQALAERYFGSARSVLAGANINEANEIVDFILDHAVLAKFSSNRIEVIQDKETNSATFNLIFTLTTDPVVSNVVNGCYLGRTGFYSPHDKAAVVLFDHRLSPMWATLSLVHQGVCARQNLVGAPVVTENKYDLIADMECSAYEAEGRILSAVGGTVWSSAVALEKGRLRRELLLSRKELGDRFEFLVDGYSTVLDTVFGKPMSLEEITDRRHSLNVAATFNLIDEAYPGNVGLRRFYKRCYIERLHDQMYWESKGRLQAERPQIGVSSASTNVTHL